MNIYTAFARRKYIFCFGLQMILLMGFKESVDSSSLVRNDLLGHLHMRHHGASEHAQLAYIITNVYIQKIKIHNKLNIN